MGLSKTASDKEIARAYRKLAKQYHPDAHPGSEERFKEVNAAYEVLGDQAKRKEYDEVRTMSRAGVRRQPVCRCGCSRGGRPGFRTSGWTTWETCSAIFSGGEPAARQGATAAGPERGRRRRRRASPFL